MQIKVIYVNHLIIICLLFISVIELWYSSNHSFIIRIDNPININRLSEFDDFKVILPKSVNILYIMSHPSLMVGILKKIHANVTNIKVNRILKGLIHVPEHFCIPNAFSTDCIIPCIIPHIIYVQFAPCQIPLTKNVTSILVYIRILEHLFPPNGIYT